METHIPIKIITLQDQQNLHPMIEAQLDGKNIRLVIDTGASHSCLDKGLVKHLLKNKNKTSADIVMGIGNKKMTNNIVTISELKLGDLTIHDYPILILKLTHINKMLKTLDLLPINGLLGSDLLHKHQAIIDYKNNVLTLNT